MDTVAQLDLSFICARYGPRGGEPYAPEILLGLLCYGYATGVFSSRTIERATYESAPVARAAGVQEAPGSAAPARRGCLPGRALAGTRRTAGRTHLRLSMRHRERRR